MSARLVAWSHRASPERRQSVPFAARQTDPGIAAHPGAISGPCSPDVIIGGVPAARMNDMFTCALPPTAGPHFPLVICSGSATVLINSFPAARVGDPTACGSSIMSGCPTVEIGGAAFASMSVVHGAITIQGSAAFVKRVQEDLAKLEALPDGAALIAGLTNVTIVEFAGLNSYAIPLHMSDAYNGGGSAAVVGYNPNLTLQANVGGGATAPTPPHLVLGHELVHASHMNHGTTQPNDEAQTIGIGAYAGTSPTENSLRLQMGSAYGQRVDHGGVAGIAPGTPPGPYQ